MIHDSHRRRKADVSSGWYACTYNWILSFSLKKSPGSPIALQCRFWDC